MSVPDLIGRYRLGPRLGSGGFAVVWLAHDESLDTQIAIKVMSEHWADRMDLRERFLTEARMLRRAASNRIVQVFDIGELPDGRPYFVMDFADRGTLADRADAGPLPLVEALRLTAEVARGAAELHRVGIVHRDLKPSNVLISSTPHGQERLLIADLGVAKSLAQASGLTMSVGSAGYMAPEQSGPNSGVDITADIYSLGAIAYRLITGEVPGLPGYVQMDSARLDRPDVPQLPPPVRKVVQRALEVDRTRRWQDATTLANQLDELADMYAVTARPRRRGPGRRSIVALVAAVAIAAAAVAGLGLIESRKPVTVQDEAKRISIDVPKSWGRQLRPTGWEPSVLKLSSDHSPALVVADDLDKWNDLNQNVNGVFVGLSTDPALAAAVAEIEHPDCTPGQLRAYTKKNPQWSGVIRSWQSCGNSSRSVQEVSLTGAGANRVYLQIRQVGKGDATKEILDSLRLSN
jgi:eukaryotic-like serine/threonine-protein kinase